MRRCSEVEAIGVSVDGWKFLVTSLTAQASQKDFPERKLQIEEAN